MIEFLPPHSWESPDAFFDYISECIGQVIKAQRGTDKIAGRVQSIIWTGNRITVSFEGDEILALFESHFDGTLLVTQRERHRDEI